MRGSPICFVLLFCTCSVVALGCGSSNSSETPTYIEGSVVDASQSPVSDLTVYIYQTYENTLTDEKGAFAINSVKHLTSAKFFFQQGDQFTNTVEVSPIPDAALAVHADFVFDRNTSGISLSQVSFDTGGETLPSEDTTPAPEATSTPSTSSPGLRPTPAVATTPKPKPTNTPKPSKFDSSGNTSSFGIPSGMKGNIGSGKTTWMIKCAWCHGSETANRSYGQIKASFRTVPSMRSVDISNQEIAHLTAYLNRSRR